MPITESERGSEDLQKEHYDSQIEHYEAHYSDEFSQLYREMFLNSYLTRNLDLRGKKVLEAMCGNGPTTPHLLSLGAVVTGLDISSKCVELFRKAHPQCETLCSSIFQTGFRDCSFDAVIVVGGLHHLYPGTDRAVEEIHRILKPGGYFCFAEASKTSFLNIFRRIWYMLDSSFEDNETPIDLDELKSKHVDQFEFVSSAYGGNIAYLLVFNSLVFRVPFRLKKLCAPALLRLESLLAKWFSSKRASCFLIAQWRKK